MSNLEKRVQKLLERVMVGCMAFVLGLALAAGLAIVVLLWRWALA